MPFELSNVVKNTFQLSLNSQGLNVLFCNKFYTTAILTFVIIVLIMMIYPCKKGTSLTVIGKLTLYIFLSVLMIIFVHDGVLYKDSVEKLGDDKTSDFINNITKEDVVYGGDSVVVSPTIGSDINNESTADAVVSGGSPDNEGDIFVMYGV